MNTTAITITAVGRFRIEAGMSSGVGVWDGARAMAEIPGRIWTFDRFGHWTWRRHLHD
jgi:hypothetical protein